MQPQRFLAPKCCELWINVMVMVDLLSYLFIRFVVTFHLFLEMLHVLCLVLVNINY